MQNKNKKEISNIKEIYDNLSDMQCPYFKEKIFFNNKGFRHLFYKSGNRKRSNDEISARSAMLATAHGVLAITTTVQEREIRVSQEEDLQVSNIYFYGFIAIVDDFKLKIVIKRDGEKGKLHFYSVIPHYVTSPKRDGNIKTA